MATHDGLFRSTSQDAYVEGMQNYVNIFTLKGKYVTMLSLKNLDENLAGKAFIRVHKSYMVAIGKIAGIEGNEIFIQTAKLPLAVITRSRL